MPDAAIDRITGALEARLPGTDPVRIGEVLHAPLPPGVRAWISWMIGERLAQDMTAARHLSRTARSPAARRIARSIVAALVPQYAADRTDALHLLRSAVEFFDAYLRRPRRELERLLMAERDHTPVEELQRRLEAVTEYRYLSVLLLRVLESPGEASRLEIRRLIAQLDDEVVRHHSPEELIRLMEPLFAWYGLAGFKGIPLEAALDFLDDKNMTVLRDHVTAVARIHGQPVLTPSELLTMIRDLAGGPRVSSHHQEPPQNAGEEAATAAPLQAQQPDQTRPGSGAPGLPEGDAGAEEPGTPEAGDPGRREAEVQEGQESGEESQRAPEQEQDVQGRPEDIRGSTEKEREDEAGPAGPEPSGRPGQAREGFKETVRRNLALSLTSAGLKGRVPAPPLTLGAIITEEQRRRFLPALFRNDPAYLDGTIQALEAMHTWQDAARYITDFLELNRLNPYAKDVLEFTDIMRRWFVRDEEVSP